MVAENHKFRNNFEDEEIMVVSNVLFRFLESGKLNHLEVGKTNRNAIAALTGMMAERKSLGHEIFTDNEGVLTCICRSGILVSIQIFYK